MILSDFKAFPRRGVIIGVDWGARRTGLAVASPDMQFTFARPAIVGAADMARAVADFALAERAAGIVVGLPMYADGTPSDTTKMVREFVEQLATITDIPICTVDESLTSAAAAAHMKSRNPRADKAKLDSESARLILENAIALLKRG